MQDLKSALLAKHVPGKVIRSRELRFDAVVLAENKVKMREEDSPINRLETALF
jgi:hypothetical protein